MSNLKFKKSKVKLGAGFTLVELLVVFSLVSIVSGLGFASFVLYSRRQVVVQAAADLKQTIELAKFNAISHVKPSTCASSSDLLAFKVNFCSNAICQKSGVDYEMDASCEGVDIVQLSKLLPQNVSFSNVPDSPKCATLTFNTVSRSVEGVPCEIFINGYGIQVKVSVDANGNTKL